MRCPVPDPNFDLCISTLDLQSAPLPNSNPVKFHGTEVFNYQSNPYQANEKLKTTLSHYCVGTYVAAAATISPIGVWPL
jgi:hypothetical protein